MVIVPCSMKTVAGVCHGYFDNLLLRAADVTIKERRKLVMLARESPLSPIHLGNMLTLLQMGVVVMPPPHVDVLQSSPIRCRYDQSYRWEDSA